MKVVILNGSPKGNARSVSIKHINYLQKRIHNDYEILPIAREIKKIEADESYLDSVLDKIKEAELIVWAYPVYLYMIPSQLKRFVEIVLRRGKGACFHGKYSTSLSTSGMIYDYPAHEYIHAISEDFKMTYMPGYSFEAVTEKSLLNDKIRESFVMNFQRSLLSVKNKEAYPRKYSAIREDYSAFAPEISQSVSKRSDKRILIISDHAPDSNLEKMVNAFKSFSRHVVEIVNLNDIEFAGGCTGCLQCQFEGRCVFADDVRKIFEEKIMGSSGVVFAATIVERHLSSAFKAFFDRSFFMAQTPKLRGKFAGFLVGGPLRQLELVNQFIDIYISNRFMVRVGTVSDEYRDSGELSRIIQTFAANMDEHIDKEMETTSSFFSRAYHLMLREMLSIISSAKTNAYNFYRKRKLFDYPHTNIKHVLRKNLYNVIFNFPFLKHKIRKSIIDFQLSSYNKLLRED